MVVFSTELTDCAVVEASEFVIVSLNASSVVFSVFSASFVLVGFSASSLAASALVSSLDYSDSVSSETGINLALGSKCEIIPSAMIKIIMIE